MLNKSIEQIAYDKYQLDWMKNHNYSLETLVAELGIYVGRFSDTPLTIEFETRQSDRGFDGTIWVCFSEFLDNEYQDEDYMKSLLNEEEFNRYKKEIEVK